MKQSDVKIGAKYLFARTETEHKKDMIGTVVCVLGKRRGAVKPQYHSGLVKTGNQRSLIRFKLDNGRYANAGELDPIIKRPPTRMSAALKKSKAI